VNWNNFLKVVVISTFIGMVSRCIQQDEEPKLRHIFTHEEADSVPYIVYKNKPVPFRVVETDSIPVHDTLWLPGDTSYVLRPVDTAAIMRDYFASAEYSDTVKDDSSALIVINEQISRNRIEAREVLFQNRRATMIYQPNNNAIVLGVGGTLTGIDVSAGFRHKRNVMSVTYSDKGVGLRYQREIVVGK
jgi:hypothetical protein